jgi:hypothetical protein
MLTPYDFEKVKRVYPLAYAGFTFPSDSWDECASARYRFLRRIVGTRE